MRVLARSLGNARSSADARARPKATLHAKQSKQLPTTVRFYSPRREVEQRPRNTSVATFVAAWGARSLSDVTKRRNILENDDASTLLRFLIVAVSRVRAPCLPLPLPPSLSLGHSPSTDYSWQCILTHRREYKTFSAFKRATASCIPPTLLFNF